MGANATGVHTNELQARAASLDPETRHNIEYRALNVQRLARLLQTHKLPEDVIIADLFLQAEAMLGIAGVAAVAEPEASAA
jgi:hypothetical protein